VKWEQHTAEQIGIRLQQTQLLGTTNAELFLFHKMIISSVHQFTIPFVLFLIRLLWVPCY